MNTIKKWHPSVQFLLLVIPGALLYGLFNRLFQNIIFPGAEFIAFRPQLVVPVTVSLMAGPWAGGAIGLFGNLFGDQLSGFGLQFWHWSLANFLIGFIPGTVRWASVTGIGRVKEFALVLLFVFLGNALGLFEGFMVHLWLGSGSDLLNVLYSWYLPALISNSYLLILLLPPLLVWLKYLSLNIETRSMFFVILYSLVIVTLLAIVLIGMEQRDLDQSIGADQMPEKEVFLKERIIRNFRWLGLVLLFIVMMGAAIGYYFSQKYLLPIYELTQASDKVKRGNWTEADKIASGKGSGEMESLIGLFNTMARDVLQREQKMQNLIRELQLRVDKTKENKLFDEITETDFFKNLEKKSKAIREKRLNPTGDGTKES